jgi:ketosteroid isomerase-like protein
VTVKKAPDRRTMTPEQVVRANFDAYVTQDRAACEALLADEMVFTSPQDDHIDRKAFLERCFPTADRFSRQELIHVVPATERDVFILYEYDLKTGGTHRNTELITVVDGLIVEVQVFFGGAVG